MILITGCDSPEGHALIKELLSKNYKLKCHDIYHPKNIPSGCDVISGMLDNQREIDHALEGVDTIVHFLEITESDRRGRKFMKQINVNLPKKLLTAAAASGVSHAIIKSSWQVYGQIEKGSVNENSPLSPRSPLGKDMKSLELLCASTKLAPMKITILRTALTVGPETVNPAILLILFLALAQENESRTNIIEGGKNIFDLLEFSDLAKAVSCAIEKKSEGIFNISGGGTSTTSDMMELFTKIDSEIQLNDFSFMKSKFLSFFLGLIGSHHLTGDHFAMLSRNVVLDISSAKKILNWSPQFDSISALNETIKWYRANKIKSKV